MSEPLPDRVEIGDSVLHQPLQKEMVLLNIDNQQYYGLNDVGARMWELLLELRSLDAVTERLETEYEIDRETLRADLERLVRDLLHAGLLKAA